MPRKSFPYAQPASHVERQQEWLHTHPASKFKEREKELTNLLKAARLLVQLTSQSTARLEAQILKVEKMRYGQHPESATPLPREGASTPYTTQIEILKQVMSTFPPEDLARATALRRQGTSVEQLAPAPAPAPAPAAAGPSDAGRARRVDALNDTESEDSEPEPSDDDNDKGDANFQDDGDEQDDDDESDKSDEAEEAEAPRELTPAQEKEIHTKLTDLLNGRNKAPSKPKRPVPANAFDRGADARGRAKVEAASEGRAAGERQRSRSRSRAGAGRSRSGAGKPSRVPGKKAKRPSRLSAKRRRQGPSLTRRSKGFSTTRLRG